MADERSVSGIVGSSEPPADERLTPTALYRAVLLAFALAVLILVFPILAGLVLLVMLVVVTAVPMSATTDRLERIRIPRAVGAPLVLLAAIAVVSGVVALLVPVFASEGRHLVRSLPSIVDSLRTDLGNVTHSSHSSTGLDIQRFVNDYTNHPGKLLGPAAAVGAGVAGGLTALLAVIITAVYSAVRPGPLVNGAVRLFPPLRRAHARHVMHRLAVAYRGWLRGLGLGMLVLGVITYLGLLAVGLPFAIVFATLTAVAMVVPYFGALVSSIPPVLFALTMSPGKALLVALVYFVSHQIEGHLVQPLVMARAVELHPALIAVGVIAVERLFGFIGLIVAVPILVTLKILVEELWMRPMEERLGPQANGPPDGGPAATPDPEAGSWEGGAAGEVPARS